MRRTDLVAAVLISTAVHAAVLLQPSAPRSGASPTGMERQSTKFAVAMLAAARHSPAAPTPLPTPAPTPLPTPAPLAPPAAEVEMPPTRRLPAVSTGPPRSTLETRGREQRAPAQAVESAALQDRDTTGENSVTAPEAPQPQRRESQLEPIRPVYPRRARKLGHEGKVLVQIIYDEEGRFVDLEVASSSGHRLLDREALAAVRRAPPRSERRSERIEVVFELEE